MLLECSPNHLKPVLITVLNSGLRYRKILSFSWEDIYLAEGYLNITKSKSGKSRQVPINSTLRNTFLFIKTAGSVSSSQLDGENLNDSMDISGRHAVLRGLYLWACGFDSRLQHHFFILTQFS